MALMLNDAVGVHLAMDDVMLCPEVDGGMYGRCDVMNLQWC